MPQPEELQVPRREFLSRGLSAAAGAWMLGTADVLQFGLDIAAAQPAPDYDRNVLLNPGRDPAAVRIGEKVCYYAAIGTEIHVLQAGSVPELAQEGFSDQTKVWDLEPGQQDSGRLGHVNSWWAPKPFNNDGTIAVYTASYGGDLDGNQRIAVIQSDSADGEYELAGVLNTGHLGRNQPKWAIDGSRFTYEGTDFFVWSGKEAPGGRVDQNLYISAMENAHTLSREQSMIASPQYSWEFAGRRQGINEAPHPFQAGDHTPLVIDFSANGSWTRRYCIGRLTLIGDDPLNPGHWYKSPRPVFKKGGEIYGPGAHTIIEDEGELWILYANKTDPGIGWDDRQVRAQRFQLDEDSLPEYRHPRYRF